MSLTYPQSLGHVTFITPFICAVTLRYTLLLFTVGLGYMAASLTVFLRDIPQTIGIGTNFLFYLTPITYPQEMISLPFRDQAHWNPLAVISELYRNITLWGSLQYRWEWLYLWNLSAVVFVLGT